jgi:TIR domain
MQVFISHATADKALARKLSKTLKKAGLDVWDGTEILPGENWAAKVAEALEESQAMVVLLTPASLRSSHVRHEISYALGDEHYERRLIPVLAAPPDQLPQEEIPWILNTFQMVSLPKHEQDDEGLEKIVRVIKEASLIPS